MSTCPGFYFAYLQVKQEKLDNDIYNDTMLSMNRIAEIVGLIKRNPRDIKFIDLCQVCEHYFGKPHQKGTSHRVYKTPWPGDPRINIQNKKGKARAYQVRQVLRALEKLELDYATKG